MGVGPLPCSQSTADLQWLHSGLAAGPSEDLPLPFTLSLDS